MAGKGHDGGPWAGSRLESYDDDTVTIVVSRKTAEDLYYAIALAMGGAGAFDMYGGGKTAKPHGKTPDTTRPPLGMTPYQPGGPKPRPKP